MSNVIGNQTLALKATGYRWVTALMAGVSVARGGWDKQRLFFVAMLVRIQE
jgi:hypothetical protein